MLFIFLKYLHIIGAIVLVGSILTMDLVTLKLLLSKQALELKMFYRESKFIDKNIIGPSAAVTALTGIVMAQAWFGWHFWLVWGLVAVVVTALTGSFILPKLKLKLINSIQSEVGSSENTRSLSLRYIGWISLNLILLFSAVATMVYKPIF